MIFVILTLVKAGAIIYFFYSIVRILFGQKETGSSKGLSTLKSFFLIVAFVFGITIIEYVVAFLLPFD